MLTTSDGGTYVWEVSPANIVTSFSDLWFEASEKRFWCCGNSVSFIAFLKITQGVSSQSPTFEYDNTIYGSSAWPRSDFERETLAH